MKNKSFWNRASAAAVLSWAVVANICGAGDLNPPAGAVEPTGKTLREIEPRTALTFENTPGDSGAAFIIPFTGSYYLTGNVTVGGRYAIEIASFAGDVTIDLMGYTITLIMGPQVNPTTGVYAPALATRTVTIRNGVIRNQVATGTTGILIEGGANTVIEDVRVQGVGRGIVVPDHSTVRRCDVSQIQSNFDDAAGIQTGLYSTVEHCRVREVNTNGTTAHIRVGAFSVVRECQIVGTAPCEIGIDVGSGSVVERNLIRNDDSALAFTGILSSGSLTARGNTLTNVTAGTSTGISCGGASTIQDNVFSGLDTGVSIGSASACLIVRNHFRASATDVQANFPASNIIGPTVGSGGAAASSNPHANYSN
ncbi:MAG: right-handed parallel beta-helix repeat-containing protein [Phycisphaerales bacterium]